MSQTGSRNQGNDNINNKNNKTSSKRKGRHNQTELNNMADKFVGEMKNWIKEGTKGSPRSVGAIVSKLYEDGTVDIYLPGSEEVKFTRIQNQSVFELNEGDSVEVFLKDGTFNNCWIFACHNPYSQARLNAVQYRNTGGAASGGGSGGGGTSGGGGGTTITKLSQLQNDVGFITGMSPTINDANLIGTPTVPTASTGTNNTQAASTAFVKTAIDNALNDSGLTNISQQIATINDNITTINNNIVTLTTLINELDTRVTALENAGGGTEGGETTSSTESTNSINSTLNNSTLNNSNQLSIQERLNNILQSTQEMLNQLQGN